MSISNILNTRKPSISFEFFPPKTLAIEKVLFDTIDSLQVENADFSSVTFGAGGSTADKTFDWINYIKDTCKYETMMHITCVGFNKVTLDNILEKLENAGIENVLALRGDIPKGSDLKQGDFKYASDLVSYIARRGKFCIGVAGYPEKHPESLTFEKDIEMLKYKVDMGASFIITQLFFNNEYFYRFRDRAEKAGIKVPIVAGIMPIVNFSQIERFKVMCSSHIPESLIKSMEGKSEEDIASIGIDYAVNQCEDLVKNQVAGLHFYTLNRSHATKRILDKLHFL